MHIYKYQSSGNDFILIDNRSGEINLSTEDVNKLCNKKFGIGSDGLIILEESENADFHMIYYNSDGHIGSMCGNGGMAVVAFADKLGIKKFDFTAPDGSHQASIIRRNGNTSTVKLGMNDVDNVVRFQMQSYVLDTGSPHLVIFVEDILNHDILKEGKYWRYNHMFPIGTNVTFVETHPELLKIRIYERGVEDETLSCGTGVVASCIASYIRHNEKYIHKVGIKVGERIFYTVKTLGGIFTVDFLRQKDDSTCFEDIHLTGNSTFVFECDIDPSIITLPEAL